MLELLCLVASFEEQMKKSNLTNYSKHFFKKYAVLIIQFCIK